MKLLCTFCVTILCSYSLCAQPFKGNYLFHRQPQEELTTGAFDLTLNNITLTHNKYPRINGADIIISVKEQRFDSTDIDFHGRYINTGTAASTQSVHASIMATIIAGGGNSSARARGVAWGGTVSSSDFSTLLPDAASAYQSNNIRLQNHSYGTGIENFYGADAAAYDAFVYSMPTLVHVFSAGNSGTSTPATGTYAGVTGHANLTGSFKMAKNVITVGHVDSQAVVLPMSSRGPSYDGRIKPDLVAYGEDGSSGAAALVSGAIALLQQAYKQTHNNNYPSAALVRAMVLNSADDLGTKGPDHTSGFGSLNTFRLLQAVEGNNFFEDAVTSNSSKIFVITVPNNTKMLRLTIAWTDTAAPANAVSALVNNLDMVLLTPSSQTIRPWIVNTKPNRDSLALPAIRGVDTLNNVEQITLDDPIAGVYQLRVQGSRVLTSAQNFAVVYQMDSLNHFMWSYPCSTDVIKAGRRNYLRWQTNIIGNGSLEWSTDGTNFTVISSAIDLSKNHFVWTAPDTFTTAILRMRLASPLTGFTSDSFIVSPPTQLRTAFNCADSFGLYWNKAATGNYELYRLGSKYMEPFLLTSDSFRVFQKLQSPSMYYAVAPRMGTRMGERSITVNYATQGVGCYIVSFYSQLQNNKLSGLTLSLGTLYGVAQVSFQKFTGGGFQTLQSLPANTLAPVFTDSNLVQGINRYRAQIILTNGQVVNSDEDQVYFFPNKAVVIYPNPARAQTPVSILVKDQGVYNIKVVDATGRLIREMQLNDIINRLVSFTLPTGIYFVQASGNNEKPFTQTLVIY